MSSQFLFCPLIHTVSGACLSSKGLLQNMKHMILRNRPELCALLMIANVHEKEAL